MQKPPIIYSSEFNSVTHVVGKTVSNIQVQTLKSELITCNKLTIGDIIIDGDKIINCEDPINDKDAVTMGYFLNYNFTENKKIGTILTCSNQTINFNEDILYKDDTLYASKFVSDIFTNVLRIGNVVMIYSGTEFMYNLPTVLSYGMLSKNGNNLEIKKVIEPVGDNYEVQRSDGENLISDIDLVIDPSTNSLVSFDIKVTEDIDDAIITNSAYTDFVDIKDVKFKNKNNQEIKLYFPEQYPSAFPGYSSSNIYSIMVTDENNGELTTAYVTTQYINVPQILSTPIVTSDITETKIVYNDELKLFKHVFNNKLNNYIKSGTSNLLSDIYKSYIIDNIAYIYTHTNTFVIMNLYDYDNIYIEATIYINKLVHLEIVNKYSEQIMYMLLEDQYIYIVDITYKNSPTILSKIKVDNCACFTYYNANIYANSGNYLYKINVADSTDPIITKEKILLYGNPLKIIYDKQFYIEYDNTNYNYCNENLNIITSSIIFNGQYYIGISTKSYYERIGKVYTSLNGINWNLYELEAYKLVYNSITNKTVSYTFTEIFLINQDLTYISIGSPFVDGANIIAVTCKNNYILAKCDLNNITIHNMALYNGSTWSTYFLDDTNLTVYEQTKFIPHLYMYTHYFILTSPDNLTGNVNIYRSLSGTSYDWTQTQVILNLNIINIIYENGFYFAICTSRDSILLTSTYTYDIYYATDANFNFQKLICIDPVQYELTDLLYIEHLPFKFLGNSLGDYIIQLEMSYDILLDKYNYEYFNISVDTVSFSCVFTTVNIFNNYDNYTDFILNDHTFTNMISFKSSYLLDTLDNNLNRLNTHSSSLYSLLNNLMIIYNNNLLVNTNDVPGDVLKYFDSNLNYINNLLTISDIITFCKIISISNLDYMIIYTNKLIIYNINNFVLSYINEIICDDVLEVYLHTFFGKNILYIVTMNVIYIYDINDVYNVIKLKEVSTFNSSKNLLLVNNEQYIVNSNKIVKLYNNNFVVDDNVESNKWTILNDVYYGTGDKLIKYDKYFNKRIYELDEYKFISIYGKYIYICDDINIYMYYIYSNSTFNEQLNNYSLSEFMKFINENKIENLEFYKTVKISNITGTVKQFYVNKDIYVSYYLDDYASYCYIFNNELIKIGQFETEEWPITNFYYDFKYLYTTRKDRALSIYSNKNHKASYPQIGNYIDLIVFPNKAITIDDTGKLSIIYILYEEGEFVLTLDTKQFSPATFIKIKGNSLYLGDQNGSYTIYDILGTTQSLSNISSVYTSSINVKNEAYVENLTSNLITTNSIVCERVTSKSEYIDINMFDTVTMSKFTGTIKITGYNFNSTFYYIIVNHRYITKSTKFILSYCSTGTFLVNVTDVSINGSNNFFRIRLFQKSDAFIGDIKITYTLF